MMSLLNSYGLSVAVIATQWIQAATLPGPDSELAFETRHSRPLAFTGRNVSWHVGSTTSSTAATCAYGPFGESLDRRSADDQNPIRYSTRYEDKETGFSYYGFRYYDPSTGRWLSRDPLTELAFSEATDKLPQELGVWAEPATFEAGDYVFLRNCPVSAVDLFGLASSCDQQVQNAFESSRNHKLLQK